MTFASLALWLRAGTEWSKIEDAFFECTANFKSTCFYDEIVQQFELTKAQGSSSREFCWLEAEFEEATVDMSSTDRAFEEVEVDLDETWYTPSNVILKCDLGDDDKPETDPRSIPGVIINDPHSPTEPMLRRWLNYLWCSPEMRDSHFKITLTFPEFCQLFRRFEISKWPAGTSEPHSIFVEMASCHLFGHRRRWHEVELLDANGSTIGKVMHRAIRNRIALDLEQYVKLFTDFKTGNRKFEFIDYYFKLKRDLMTSNQRLENLVTEKGNLVRENGNLVTANERLRSELTKKNNLLWSLYLPTAQTDGNCDVGLGYENKRKKATKMLKNCLNMVGCCCRPFSFFSQRAATPKKTPKKSKKCRRDKLGRAAKVKKAALRRLDKRPRSSSA